MSSRISLTGDPAEFARQVGAFLEERPICNVMATVLDGLRGRMYDGAGRFAWVTGPDGTIAGAALRTPPWPMLCSPLAPGLADELVERWLGEDPGLDAVNAQTQTARELVAAWMSRTGGRSECRMRMAMYVLETVIDPPRPAGGELVGGTTMARDELVEWWRAFVLETGLTNDASHVEATVDRRLGDDAIHIWRDQGRPVSLVAVNRPVAGVVRVGPVYTPPEHRRRGYASSAVAAASRRALAAGSDRCMLFTDLANPTSNRIYGEVGYRHIEDFEELALIAPDRP